eukprot:2841645-Alexandrium_andersonii.AAC.1
MQKGQRELSRASFRGLCLLVSSPPLPVLPMSYEFGPRQRGRGPTSSDGRPAAGGAALRAAPSARVSG